MGLLSRFVKSESDVEESEKCPIAFAREHRRCRRSVSFFQMWPFAKKQKKDFPEVHSAFEAYSDCRISLISSEQRNSSTSVLHSSDTEIPSRAASTAMIAPMTKEENAPLETKLNMMTAATALNVDPQTLSAKYYMSASACSTEEEDGCVAVLNNNTSSPHVAISLSEPEMKDLQSDDNSFLRKSSLSHETTPLLTRTDSNTPLIQAAEDYPTGERKIMKVKYESGKCHTSAVTVQKNRKNGAKSVSEENVSLDSEDSDNVFISEEQCKRNEAKLERIWRILSCEFMVYVLCVGALGLVFLVLAQKGRGKSEDYCPHCRNVNSPFSG